MQEFNQIVSVNFQGMVVVFGRAVSGDDKAIYYNVLGQNVDANDDSLDWAGFTKLDFTEQVRQVGMTLLTLATDSATMVPATEAFRVVTDQKYISVVQQSQRGTLYVNRFRLVQTKSGTDQKTITYTLSPAWEVRFERSHKEDIPADKSDKQDYLDPDETPFLEPSMELSMITGVASGNFEVIQIPVSGTDRFAWQFFTLDAQTNTVKLFNFPSTDNGLIDISGKTPGADYRIPPDSTFSVTKSGSATALPFLAAPRAALYVKHEKVVQPDGSSIGVRRATRVMLTLPVTDAGKPATATIDSAVGTSGTIAFLSGPIATADLVPAPFDLHFNGVATLGFTPPAGKDDPLAITGPYSMRLLFAPGTMGDGVPLVGGAPGTEEKSLAPFVRIVDGDKLEVGFGNGTTAVRCRTLHQVLFTDVWTDCRVTYAGKGDNPFTMTVNGSLVPLLPCTTSAEPCGTPVSLIGATSGGFVGALKALEIAAGATSAVTLACESVDYTTSPPTTPNSAASGVTVTVQGVQLEPSSAPVLATMSGAFFIDAAGLTYYAGLAGFIAPHSAGCLIDGSDGLLHLYYEGTDSLLTVAQFSTTSARATFTADWSTDWGAGLAATRETSVARYRGVACDSWRATGRRLLTAPDTTQTGFLNFVSHRVGTAMNGTKITVAPSTVSTRLCDITVETPQNVGTETWRGLPRDVSQLSRIWNGAGSNNPDDKDVIRQSKPYFDYAGAAPAVLVPTRTAASGAFFLFTSVPQLPVALAAVQVDAGSTDAFVALTLTVAAPSHWPATETLRQVWPNVPAAPQSLLDILAGKSTQYAYDAVTTPGTRAYGVPVSLSRSDDQISHVLFFVRDSQKDFSIVVTDGSATRLCTVTVCGVSLPDVPRQQDQFVATINGDNADYPYPDGYRTGLATQIFALCNGLTADVVNAASATAGGALAYAGLVRALYQGQSLDPTGIATQPATPAAVIQNATLSFNGHDTAITGSMLFGAVIESPPTNGGIGRVGDTSSFSEGHAPVLTPGVNGGWTPLSPRFSLGLNQQNATNYVSVNVAKEYAPADALAVASDMTVEAWMQLDADKSPACSRVLSYNVTGNREHPDLPVQYLIGAQQGPALVLANNTFITCGYNFTPPNMTVQVYVYLPDQGLKGTILGVSEAMGSTQFAKLSLDESRKAVWTFLGTATVQTDQSIPTGAWVCLTGVVTDAGQGKVTLGLSINGAAPKTATATNSFTGKLGSLTVGSRLNDALPARVNGVAFWQRALSDREVAGSYAYGFADTDAMLGIRWNLAEGTGTAVVNSAATGAEYDGEVTNPATPSWDVHGAFQVPLAGRNELTLASNRILKGWTHVALASRQGHGLRLNGKNSGKVEDGDAFNPSSAFALEAWVCPSAMNQKQIILEKPGSYSLSINTLGQVCLHVDASMDPSGYDQSAESLTHEVKATIPVGKTSYVAVNFSTGSTQDESGSTGYVSQKYRILAGLFVNGVKVKDNNRLDLPRAVTVATDTSSFYVGVSGEATFNFAGLLSHVRVWNRTLTADEIAQTYALRLTPTSTNGLIAGWDFDEMSGTTAKDITSNNNLVLTSNQLWTIWQDVAQANLVVNGRTSLPRRITVDDAGGYGDSQCTFGGLVKDKTLTLPFAGQLDDVRLFATRLTEQQIRESMNSPLCGGEDNLAAYWTIEAGSGGTIFDLTGQGNNGSLLPTARPPVWRQTAAPIQNEAQYVVNALGGQADYFVAAITGQPSVIEYAGAERNAYDTIISVMKRGYFYHSSGGATELEVGYKVGDLDTIFVGQVQSNPTIVGFIEGGPPIPSENQTLAYWVDDKGGPARLYAGISTVTYQESETKTWTFTGNQTSTFNGELNIKGGLYQKSKSEVSVGVGAEAQTLVLENKITAGAKGKIAGTIGGGEQVSQSQSNTVSLSTSMTPAGGWEAADAILNPTVGRRYIPNNVGIALVKSATADLYMLALKGTQTPVGYTLAPNTTIPVDTNILDFPINPRYVKNGTLDGKVGLVNDPDYPEADQERGSYFKPVEAYAIKQKVERQEQQLKAFYDQLVVDSYRTINSLDSLKDKLKTSKSYDFEAQKNLRGLYNNYVWTAAGGLHKEEYTVANSYCETYVGASSLTFALGLEFKADIGTPFGGYYIEADTMLGNAWTMTATKAEALSNGFRLNCGVSPTDFLAAPKISKKPDGTLQFDGYEANAAPGKVDAYRYMSFLLPPEASNFTALSKVVDQNWLQNSTTATAGAMREAMGNACEPWRVLFRTTYVSRVPAPFQPVRDDTAAPNVTPPANLNLNVWLVTVIGRLLGTNTPTRLQIGTAIDTLLGTSAAGPGLLRDLIPWWSDFFTAAAVYGSEPFLEMATLRLDLLNYMASKYEAQNASS